MNEQGDAAEIIFRQLINGGGKSVIAAEFAIKQQRLKVTRNSQHVLPWYV
jgi:hypothetical protein